MRALASSPVDAPIEVIAATSVEERARGRHRYELWIGCAILATIALASVLVPVFSPYGPNELGTTPLAPPSAHHLFGTDALGRDVFTRVFAAGRLDLLVIVAAVLPPMVSGTLLGAGVALSRRRAADVVLMRVTDAVVAFPFVVLILVIVVVIGTTTTFPGLPAGLPSFFIAVYLIAWAFYARLGRNETLSLRERDYVLAARVLGYSPWRVLVRHIAPALFGTAFTLALADMISVVAALAALPFLGAGVQPPTAEWGAMMFEGRANLDVGWFVAAAPAAAMLLTGIALTLIGDALIGRRSAAA